MHVQHLYYARTADVALVDTCKETVAPQVVEPVHVELAADELVQVVLGVFVLEYLDGQVKLVAQLMVYLSHHHQRYLFVGYALEQCVFKHMAERAVPYVVHQYCRLDGLAFILQIQQFRQKFGRIFV